MFGKMPNDAKMLCMNCEKLIFKLENKIKTLEHKSCFLQFQKVREFEWERRDNRKLKRFKEVENLNKKN